MTGQDEATAAVTARLGRGLRKAVCLAAGLPAATAALALAAGAGPAALAGGVAAAALLGLAAGWRTGAATVGQTVRAAGSGLRASIPESEQVSGLGASVPGPWGPEEGRRGPAVPGGRLGDDPGTITGLPGSEMLSETGDEVVTGAVLSLRLVGLDRVGEAFGRAEAEAAIVRAARQILSALRDRDDMLDLGGGRFAAILLGTGKAQAELVAARVADLVRGGVKVRGETGAVAALAGVAVAPLGARLGDLVASAERAVGSSPVAGPVVEGGPAGGAGSDGRVVRRPA